jgi:hypothetical protein
MSMGRYLEPTALLDYRHPSLRKLIDARGWADLDATEGIGAVYTFVRDEITFGYNAADDVPASAVLADGYGQCNTKTTLLMALLRGIGVPVRFHGATVHKSLQRGVVKELPYRLAPADIIHSWAEVHTTTDGSGSKASSSTPPTFRASAAPSPPPRRGRSSATASAPTTSPTPRSDGTAPTPPSRPPASTTTTASTTTPTLSTAPTAPTSPGPQPGCSRTGSGTP